MSFIMRPVRFAPTGYVVEGSALPDGDGYLARYAATNTTTRSSARIATINIVVKRVTISTRQFLLYQQANGNTENAIVLELDANDKLHFKLFQVDNSTARIERLTTQRFRDISAWMDIHIAFNTGLTTDECCRIHINGVEITAFDTKTNTDSARDHGFLNSSKPLYWFGNADSLPSYGYVARALIQDGVFGVPSDVGETTSDGFWQLKDASELTFGNNGVLLEDKTIATGTDKNVTGYSPGSVVFNGTPYITRGADLTSNADGNTGLISIWVKFGTDGSSEFLWGATTDNNEIQVYRRSDNKIWVLIQDTGNNGDLFLKTGETVTVSDGWTHLLISWDVSAGYSDIYIDDVQSSLSLDTTTSGGLDYTHSNHNFFASDSGDSGEIFNGEAADYWLTVNQARFELTTVSNRRKFITAGKTCVDLGSDGSTPTGTAPMIFFHLDRGEAPANFFANAGTGGACTLAAGSLTEGSDPNGRHFAPVGTILATNDSPTNGDA